MDNMYQPPSGGSQDNWPTQELGPAGGQPHRPGSGRRSMRWSAGIALAALLAGGGALAATELTGSPAAVTPGSAGQAAALNTILSSASSPGSASAPAASAAGPVTASASAASTADAAALSPSAAAAAGRTVVGGRCQRAVVRLRAARHPRAARWVGRFCRNRLLRLLVLGGMHGQFTFGTKSGPRTIAFARGVLESVTTGQVVVKSADGTSWTWDLVRNTTIREAGRAVGRGALTDGERVFVGGPVVNGTNDARLVVIRRDSGHSNSNASGSPSG